MACSPRRRSRTSIASYTRVSAAYSRRRRPFNKTASNSVSSCRVRYDGDNLSDHNALILSLNFDMLQLTILPVMEESNNYVPRIVWRKASEEHLSRYRQLLGEWLNDIRLNDDCATCVDFKCREHDNSIENFYNAIVNCCLVVSNTCIPLSSPRRTIAGWSEIVKPFKQRSIFWHSIWKSSGGVRHGLLHSLMLKTKA